MDTYEGRPSDPMSLHKYLYTVGNPVNGADPSGNFTVDEVLIVAAISITLMAIPACTSRPKNITVGVDFQNTWDLGNSPEDVLTAPEQMLVKNTALQTMREAYQGYAVIFSEGPSGTNRIRVENQLGDGAGKTNFPEVVSHVYFWNLWGALEDVLDCFSLSKCVRKGYDRTTVAMALGRGIGATGAHELGHQGGLGFVYDIPCNNCYDSDTAKTHEHFFEPLHWSDGAKQRMKQVLPAGQN